jgi:hypothetical protein
MAKTLVGKKTGGNNKEVRVAVPLKTSEKIALVKQHPKLFIPALTNLDENLKGNLFFVLSRASGTSSLVL